MGASFAFQMQSFLILMPYPWGLEKTPWYGVSLAFHPVFPTPGTALNVSRTKPCRYGSLSLPYLLVTSEETFVCPDTKPKVAITSRKIGFDS